MIGLGLGDERDITIKGLEIIRQSKRVFLESYTSILTVGVERLS
jgi:diphthine synthase